MLNTVLGVEVPEVLGKAALFIGACLVAGVICHFVVRFLRKIFNAADVPSASIFINIARVLIWAFCLLAVVQPVFGISPTALVAALGVTSLAISLGLQDTISNIIGGLELMAGKVIQPGDFIEVNGFRGEVTDVNWRSTTLRNRYGDEQVIPNSLLNETALTRLDPGTAAKYSATIVVDHDADLEAVTKEIKELVGTALHGQLKEEFFGGVRVMVAGTDVYGTQCSVFLYLKDEIVPYVAIDTALREIASKPWIAREQ